MPEDDAAAAARRAMEAYRKAHPRQADAVDEAMAQGELPLDDEPTAEPPPPPEPAQQSLESLNGLAGFVRYADRARSLVPESKVDWSESPLAWMRHNGPRTKSTLGKAIVRDWLTRERNTTIGEARRGSLAHFVVSGKATTVHFGVVGKEGRLEFSQLAEDGYGVDAILLLGIEPHRVRIWHVNPEVVRSFPSWGQQVEGLHHCDFDPDDVPEWAKEMASWS